MFPARYSGRNNEVHSHAMILCHTKTQVSLNGIAQVKGLFQQWSAATNLPYSSALLPIQG